MNWKSEEAETCPFPVTGIKSEWKINCELIHFHCFTLSGRGCQSLCVIITFSHSSWYFLHRYNNIQTAFKY